MFTQVLFVCASRQPAAYQGVRSPGISVVGPQSANLCEHQQGFRCLLGLLFGIHSPGAEGGGVPEAADAAESSLTSAGCLYFLFLFEKFFLFKPPLVQTSTWLLTQPSLALSQESCCRPCARAGASASLGPVLVPGTLLSLSTLLMV